jgi:hypothetical protein
VTFRNVPYVSWDNPLAATILVYTKLGPPRHRVELRLGTVPALIHTPSLDTPLTITRFILGLVPLPVIPTRAELEDYPPDNFSTTGERFRLPCTQDFMHIK